MAVVVAAEEEEAAWQSLDAAEVGSCAVAAGPVAAVAWALHWERLRAAALAVAAASPHEVAAVARQHVAAVLLEAVAALYPALASPECTGASRLPPRGASLGHHQGVSSTIACP